MGTGRRLEVAGHLTVRERFERYRGAEDAAVKAHLQVIWLKAQGWQTREVARSTGFKTDWVRRLVRRYNEHGPESLGDRRASNGREPLLSEAQRQELLAALGKPPVLRQNPVHTESIDDSV
jgi:winged helix-turn helix protein